jgi:hypothetical protein
MTGGRGAAIPLWAARDRRIFPENLQTASRETIVFGGFEEWEKRQHQRAG